MGIEATGRLVGELAEVVSEAKIVTKFIRDEEIHPITAKRFADNLQESFNDDANAVIDNVKEFVKDKTDTLSDVQDGTDTVIENDDSLLSDVASLAISVVGSVLGMDID